MERVGWRWGELIRGKGRRGGGKVGEELCEMDFLAMGWAERSRTEQSRENSSGGVMRGLGLDVVRLSRVCSM